MDVHRFYKICKNNALYVCICLYKCVQYLYFYVQICTIFVFVRTNLYHSCTFSTKCVHCTFSYFYVQISTISVLLCANMNHVRNRVYQFVCMYKCVLCLYLYVQMYEQCLYLYLQTCTIFVHFCLVQNLYIVLSPISMYKYDHVCVCRVAFMYNCVSCLYLYVQMCTFLYHQYEDHIQTI